MTNRDEHTQRMRELVTPDIETMEDGYKVWWPVTWGKGYMGADNLRIIADYLDELNKEWHEIVIAECSSKQT